MPMGLVKTPRDEELWSKAKAAAKKQGRTEDWAYINGIYQRMKGHKKAASLIEPLVKRAEVNTQLSLPLQQRLDIGGQWHAGTFNASAAAKGGKERAVYDPKSHMIYLQKPGEQISKTWQVVEGRDGNAVMLQEMTKKSSLLASLEKSARVLSTRGRKQVAKKNFAMPASAAKSGAGQKGSYPIFDLPHARSALSYGKRFLSADDYAKLRARVHAKYPNLKKGNDMSKKGSILDGLLKKAGKVPGVPDATGPYGRGLGPGKGTKSGLGLVMAKMDRGEELTEKEKAILETARGKIKK